MDIYFYASKIFWFAAKPSNLLLLAVTIGTVLLATRFRRSGQALLVLGLSFFWFAAVVPIGEQLMLRLESRFPMSPEMPPDVGGIIVLGGAVNAGMSRDTGQLNLNGNAERLFYFNALAEKNPELPLIFTGGSGDPADPEAREADLLKRHADVAVLPLRRVAFERDARNTRESAVFARPLAADRLDRPWVLVTSARHMPRAVGLFRAQGWHVVAYPVDFIIPPGRELALGFGFLGGLSLLDSAIYEFIGLAAARVLGHTDRLFPAPVD